MTSLYMNDQEERWAAARWVKIAKRQPVPCKAVAARQRGHYFQLYQLASGEIIVTGQRKYRDASELEDISPGVEWLEECISVENQLSKSGII